MNFVVMWLGHVTDYQFHRGCLWLKHLHMVASLRWPLSLCPPAVIADLAIFHPWTAFFSSAFLMLVHSLSSSLAWYKLSINSVWGVMPLLWTSLPLTDHIFAIFVPLSRLNLSYFIINFTGTHPLRPCECLSSILSPELNLLRSALFLP